MTDDIHSSETHLASARQALKTLHEILDRASGMQQPVEAMILRDARIQRFKCSYEICVKALRTYLLEVEKQREASPRGCVRAAVRLVLLAPEDGEAWLLMADVRNRTTHTYIEALAAAVYGRIPQYTAL